MCLLHIICSQVNDLTGELHSVREERDNLVSAQAEDNERLKAEAVKLQEELEKSQKDLADADLGSVQLNQQHAEMAEQLAKVQTDLEHLLEENGSLLNALEEAKQKVDMAFVCHFNLMTLMFDLLEAQ